MTTPITQAAREAAEKVMGHCAHKAVRLPNKYAVEEIIQTAIDQARAADSVTICEAEKRIQKAEAILARLGYSRCTVAACNCGGYHK